MVAIRQALMLAFVPMTLASCDLPEDPGGGVGVDGPVEDVGVARQEHGGEATCTSTSITTTPSESGSVIAVVPGSSTPVITKSPTNHYVPSSCPHQWVVEISNWSATASERWTLPSARPPTITDATTCASTWVQENYYGYDPAVAAWTTVQYTRFLLGSWNSMTSTCSFVVNSSSGNASDFEPTPANTTKFSKIRGAFQSWMWFDGGRIDYRPVDVMTARVPG